MLKQHHNIQSHMLWQSAKVLFFFIFYESEHGNFNSNHSNDKETEIKSNLIYIFKSRKIIKMENLHSNKCITLYCFNFHLVFFFLFGLILFRVHFFFLFKTMSICFDMQWSVEMYQSLMKNMYIKWNLY